MEQNAGRDASRRMHEGSIFSKAKRHAYSREKFGLKSSNPFRSSALAGSDVSVIEELPRTKTSFTGAIAKSRAVWNEKLDERRALDAVASHRKFIQPCLEG